MGRARTGQGEGARAPPDMGKELAPPLGRTSRAAGKEPYLRAPPGRREVVPVCAAGKKQRPVRGQRPAHRRGGEEPDLAQPDLGPRAAGEGAAAGDGAAELGRPPANPRDLPFLARRLEMRRGERTTLFWVPSLFEGKIGS